MTIAAASMTARWQLGERIIATAVVLMTAVAGTMAVALLNSVWFDLVNGLANATEPVTRGLLYSSWLVIIGGPVVVLRPNAFGFRLGAIREHLVMLGLVTSSATAGTVMLLRVIGSTPYNDASLFIEAVDVPLTEELVFRGVLVTALLVVLSRLWAPATAGALAITFDALAFGAGHLANLAALPALFVIGQSVFAAVLGGLCAFVMVRTRSVYPAIALHAAVNAAVVLAP